MIVESEDDSPCFLEGFEKCCAEAQRGLKLLVKNAKLMLKQEDSVESNTEMLEALTWCLMSIGMLLNIALTER